MPVYRKAVSISSYQRYDLEPPIAGEKVMKNPLKLLSTCALVSVFASQFASAAPPEMPKPSAEHKRLGYFVGTWTSEGEMKPSEMGPGGKVTSTDKCEWFEGGYAVVCHSEGSCPMGATKSLGIMSYTMEEKAYTYYGLDNMGMTMATVPHGTLQGDTWTYEDESTMGGKPVKMRVTLKELSPTAYTFAMDMAGPDGKWNRFMESKYTKVK